MGLWAQFTLDMDAHRAVTLVGGGGKTSIMYALAQEARTAGRTVIVTTSTHILPHPRLLLTGNPDPEHLRACLKEHGILMLGVRSKENKLCGVGDIGLCKEAASVVVVEGDGAKFLPLKAPEAHEPAIPPATDAVIAVAGMDSVGQPIEAVCHRPQRVCALLDKPPDALVTREDVAVILSSPQGGRKGVAPYMAFRCALNKAECNPQAARWIAQALKDRGIPAAITSFREEERGGLCWF